MQFKLVDEKENKLFNRKEIQINIKAEVTPSHEEAKKLISEKFSTHPENIRIKKISGKFGSKIFEISANIYDSKEGLKKTEFFSKKELERQKSIEEIPTESKQSAEEKKEEAPAKKENLLEKEQEVSNEIVKEKAKEEN